MGYCLTIGEAKFDFLPNDLHLSVVAEAVTLPEAPNCGPIINHSNYRSPNYANWQKFCSECGPSMMELFYGLNSDNDSCSDEFHRDFPLLMNHPGHAVICQDDLKIISDAKNFRILTNAGRPDSFFRSIIRDEKDYTLIDLNLDRLIWLEFWFDWALKNCKIPIIHNL